MRSRPWPAVNEDTQFFWDGLREGELRIQRCSQCASQFHPPKPRCSTCGSFDLGYAVASGRGVVYSHVTFHKPMPSGFDGPYNVSLVDLEEGVRLVTQVVGVSPEAVRIGLPVALEITEIDEGLWLPLFRPTQQDGE